MNCITVGNQGQLVEKRNVEAQCVSSLLMQSCGSPTRVSFIDAPLCAWLSSDDFYQS